MGLLHILQVLIPGRLHGKKYAATLALADACAMFAEGKAAMMFDGSWVLNSVEDNPDMRMISCPVFEDGTGEEGAVIADYASGWFMSKAAYERSRRP